MILTLFTRGSRGGRGVSVGKKKGPDLKLQTVGMSKQRMN